MPRLADASSSGYPNWYRSWYRTGRDEGKAWCGNLPPGLPPVSMAETRGRTRKVADFLNLPTTATHGKLVQLSRPSRSTTPAPLRGPILAPMVVGSGTFIVPVPLRQLAARIFAAQRWRLTYSL